MEYVRTKIVIFLPGRNIFTCCEDNHLRLSAHFDDILILDIVSEFISDN